MAKQEVNEAKAAKSTDPLVGRYVICRCYSAGVHAGVLVEQVGDMALLSESRRLWQWHAVAGVALSGVAVSGLRAGKCKIDTQVELIRLTGVIETIPCTDEAATSIRGY